MCAGDLYPKGKKLRSLSTGGEVEYVCHAGDGIHIVLAEPLDFIDDRVREVREHEILDEEGTNVRMLLEVKWG